MNKKKMIIKKIIKSLHTLLSENWSQIKFNSAGVKNINLCCGSQKIPGYIGIDIAINSDLRMNLESGKLPFKNNSLDSVICISAINYFTRSRGKEIINEVFRILKAGGIARFAVQDLEKIAQRYIEKDIDFFFQKLPNGQERFEGPTLGDKFAAWFYGYISGGAPCKYFYDYESLSYLFQAVGFSKIEKKAYQESRLENIKLIDNRPDQMFFLEAVK
jgi:SAM-dependent methyltransferase